MAFAKKHKRTIASALILMLVMVPFLATAVLISPKKASAVVPVSDAVVRANTMLTAGIKTWEKAEWHLDLAMRVLGQVLLRQVLAMMTNDIIAWINHGGKPRFISDWEGFLKSAADSAAGAFVDEYLGLGWMCRPFDLDIKIALLPEPKFNERVRCTITDIVENIEDFYDDFSKGGWRAWIELTKPQNNMYGAYFMALDAKMGAAAEARDAAEKEALAGSGFLGARDEFGRVTTPGRLIADTASKVATQELDLLREQIADLTDALGPYEIYVTAIANALINRVIREGFSMLTGVGGDEKAVPGPTYEEYQRYQAGEIPELSSPDPGEPYPSTYSLPPSTTRLLAETEKLTAENISRGLGLLMENLDKLRDQQDLNLLVLNNIKNRQIQILQELQTNYTLGLPLPTWTIVREISTNVFEISASGVGKITLTKTSETTYDLGQASPEAQAKIDELNAGQSNGLSGIGRNEIQNLITAINNVKNNELAAFIKACNDYIKYYEAAGPTFSETEIQRLKELEQARQTAKTAAINAAKSVLFSESRTLEELNYDTSSNATGINTMANILEQTRGLASDEPGENTLYGKLAELDEKLAGI